MYLANYATKSELKNATGVDTSKFAKKTYLARLKSDIGKLDIDKLEKEASALSSLKNKVYKLDFDKVVSAPVDLKNVVVVDQEGVKKDVYDKFI